MSQFHFLFDSSALLKRYNKDEKGHEFVNQIFAKLNVITVHFPEICISEILQSFHRKVKERRISSRTQEILKKSFLEDIKQRLICIYHLSDRDIIGVDQIIPKAWLGNMESKPKAGAMDCSVISSAVRFREVMSGVFLVSSDEGMNIIAKAMNIKIIDPENCTIKKLKNLIQQKKTYPMRKILRMKRKSAS